MPSATTDTIDRLAWDGVVDVRVVAAIGVVLALAAAWIMWRERRAIGLRWATAFWALRMAAFGCALWMLAGPTWLRIERTTTPQRIAVFADGSGSMDVVDPQNPLDSLRWTLAADGDSSGSPLVECDRLAVALAAALAECHNIERSLTYHAPARAIEGLLATVATLIDHTAERANAAAAALEKRDAALADRSSRIAALLSGAVMESISQLKSALAASRGSGGEDVAAAIEQLSQGVGSARRRAVVLCTDVAQWEANAATGDSQSVDGVSRRTKVGAALNAFDADVGEHVSEIARIERFRFDRLVSPVDAAGDWTSALAGKATAQAASGDDASPADGEAPTNLSAVFQQLAERQVAGGTRLAVVLSDGRHNDAEAITPQDAAAQLTDLPVFIVPIGNAERIRDALVHRVEAPKAVAENDSAVIDVIVTGYDGEGQSSAVVLKQGGHEVDRQEFEFASNHSDFRAQFTVPAKTRGWQEYIVEVEPIDDEVNTANNFQPVSFEVVRDENRVLLADSAARWEFRYLSQLFRRDEHVKCDELLFFPQVHGTGALADRPELPQTADEWSRYDVVILGDVSPRQISTASQQALGEFVARGGNLIVIAGHSSMPAAFAGQKFVELLPVTRNTGVLAQQGFILQITDEGSLHSALAIAESLDESRQAWTRIYRRFPVYGLSEFCTPKATAHTLLAARAADDPADNRTTDERQLAFLSWQRVGAGRVVYLAAPETYRLRWRHGDRMHHLFWGQLLRWMTAANAGAGVELVRLQTNRTRYGAGEAVEATVWLRDPDGRPLAGERLQVEARSFDDAVRTALLEADPRTPGRYVGTLENLTPGAYQIAVAGKIVDELLPKNGGESQVETTISVRSGDNVERSNTQSNRALLQQLAEATGGQVIPPTALGELLQLVSFTPQVSERVERTPIWNHWSNLFIVLGCLTTEWIVRKQKGLA